MHKTGYPEERFVEQIMDREPRFVFQRMGVRDTYAKVLLRNRGYPKILIHNWHDTEADVQFPSEHSCFQVNRCVSLQNDTREIRAWRAQSSKKRLDLPVDVERMPDEEWPAILDRYIKCPV